MSQEIYALYKGDKFLSVGTIKEIAEELNMNPDTVRYYGSGAYKKKLERRINTVNAKILIRVEE